MQTREEEGRAAARRQASAWFSFWSGVTDCPHIRPPQLEPAEMREWFQGHDAELRRQRQAWLHESVHA